VTQVPARLSVTERGFTLIESLVTIVIVGIAFAVFVGGMGTAIMAADYHRKQAVSQATVRNFAESVKAANYVDCATADAYGGRAGSAYAATTSPIAPSVRSLDTGAQMLTFFAVGANSSFIAPAGMTKRFDDASSGSANAVTASLADQALADSGATGTRTATSLVSGDAVAQSFALDSLHSATGVQLTGSSHLHSTTNSLTLTVPTGAVPGNVLIAQVAVRDTTTTITPPAGWTLLTRTTTGTTLQSLIYRAALTPQTSLRWVFSAAKESAGGVAAYSGASPYVREVTKVSYWNGTTFPDPPGTCTADQGLQLIHLHVTSADKTSVQDIDVVKRKP
jgi:prepilin-type N-terminal cleavage/methylation domain-containing protein